MDSTRRTPKAAKIELWLTIGVAVAYVLSATTIFLGWQVGVIGLAAALGAVVGFVGGKWWLRRRRIARLLNTPLVLDDDGAIHVGVLRPGEALAYERVVNDDGTVTINAEVLTADGVPRQSASWTR